MKNNAANLYSKPKLIHNLKISQTSERMSSPRENMELTNDVYVALLFSEGKSRN